VALVGVHVIDVVTGTVLRDRTVIMRGGEIVSISPTASFTITGSVRLYAMRGKYVMEVLMGVAPPAPPANVPPLMENVENEKALSVRERLAQHRANAACAACHNMMDPIGLSLENFDAIGNRRRTHRGVAVDPSGRLFDGTPLDGPVSLRTALLAHTDSFVTTFAENFLSYGLGRLLDARDMPTVRAIVRDAAAKGYQWSAIVAGIVTSPAFVMREAAGGEHP